MTPANPLDRFVVDRANVRHDLQRPSASWPADGSLASRFLSPYLHHPKETTMNFALSLRAAALDAASPRRRALAAIAAGAALLMPLAAPAQGAFPSKPIRIVVPFGAG